MIAVRPRQAPKNRGRRTLMPESHSLQAGTARPFTCRNEETGSRAQLATHVHDEILTVAAATRYALDHLRRRSDQGLPFDDLLDLMGDLIGHLQAHAEQVHVELEGRPQIASTC